MRVPRSAVLTCLAGAVAAVYLVMAGGVPAGARGAFPPDFTGTALDGRKVTLSEFRDRAPVVLNFYADFCKPCRQEFPHLKLLDEKFGSKGLKVIAVSLDGERDTAAALPNETRVKFPVIFDPRGTIAERFKVQAIPHTVVLERDGTIHRVLIGRDAEALDRAVASVIRN